jgi:hypothetical protein
MGTAVAMIGHQVGGKATRDALFLSSFDVTRLPQMMIASALLSILAVLAITRLMQRVGPIRVVPATLTLSAMLSLVEWAIYRQHAGLAAVLLYLHIGALGAVLISGFWSLVNEHFDPYTAKKRISRIAAAGTLGGLIGGLIAERTGSTIGIGTMLPALAAAHLVAAGLVRALRPLPAAEAKREAEARATAGESTRRRSSWRILSDVPYLRNLALLTFLATIGAALIDYVFKSRATMLIGGSGPELIRFFALFYTALSLVTFLVQTSVGRLVLERLGLSWATASVPLAITAGSAGLLLTGGLAGAAIARGLENVVRSSLFRSGYELFFTPIPAQEKRGTKTIIDVGFDRLGDAVGGGLVTLLLAVAAARSDIWLAVLAAAIGLAGLIVTRRLHTGYVRALERSLISQGGRFDGAGVEDLTTRTTVMRTVAALRLSTGTLRALDGEAEAEDETRGARGTAPATHLRPGALITRSGSGLPAVPPATGVDASATDAGGAAATGRATGTATGAATGGATGDESDTATAGLADPHLRRIAALRSRDAARIRDVLADRDDLTPDLAPHLIPLLAWDEVSQDVIDALQTLAPRTIGQLLDALLDHEQEFAIRRRIPRVLYVCRTQRVADGLVRGLEDRRFEVRFQCARALSIIRGREPGVRIDPPDVMAAVRREAAVGHRVWRSQRLLDQVDELETPGFAGAVLRHRSGRSLEHVFTLLSLVLPADPLRIAYRGLQTDDPALRGTALEYLETVLPADVHDRLWPLIEGDTRRPRSTRAPDEVLAELLRSHQSIEMNLADLRERHGARGGEADRDGTD